jgi:hypothetical protein
MRELVIPAENEGDENATEVARVWLGNGTCNISLLLGMYADAEDSVDDELYAWGNILSDIAQHIANGMKQSHGWDETETMRALRTHFNEAIKSRAPGLVGTYVDEH